jgi:hypothetical protein
MATARRISDANAKLQRMDGYEQFHSNLPFATELDTDQASQEVVLAATRGDRSAQGESLWNFLDTIIAGYNLERPKEYIGVIHVWDFWPQFWNCENFMVNPQRRRPALVIASGYLRGHDGAGNCTFEVWDRLQAICDAHSVPLEHL